MRPRPIPYVIIEGGTIVVDEGWFILRVPSRGGAYGFCIANPDVPWRLCTSKNWLSLTDRAYWDHPTPEPVCDRKLL
jgi:hypothetical protein